MAGVTVTGRARGYELALDTDAAQCADAMREASHRMAPWRGWREREWPLTLRWPSGAYATVRVTVDGQRATVDLSSQGRLAPALVIAQELVASLAAVLPAAVKQADAAAFAECGATDHRSDLVDTFYLLADAAALRWEVAP